VLAVQLKAHEVKLHGLCHSDHLRGDRGNRPLFAKVVGGSVSRALLRFTRGYANTPFLSVPSSATSVLVNAVVVNSNG
jgi:hypothetical protein